MPGTIPTAVCDVHVEAQICTLSKKLATQFCPEQYLATKVFLKARTNNRVGDSKYTVPKDFCNIHTSAIIPTPVPTGPALTPTPTPTIAP